METVKRKSGNRYREKIYFNGKEEKSPFFIRKSDAKIWKRKKLAERDKAIAFGQSSLSQNKKVTFRDFSKEWLTKTIQIKNSKKTFDNYESTLRIHLLPIMGDKILHSITLYNGQELVKDLIERNYKPKGISNIIMVLKSIFNEAEKKELILKSPFKYLDIPKIPKKVALYWNESEINIFLRANINDELYPLYVTALNTGCRRGELAALKWHQILFNQNLIEVSATRDKSGRRETTKNGKNRYVPMNEITRLTLERIFRGKLSEYVFTHQDGSPIRVNHLYRYFKKAQDKSSVGKKLTFHKLRDTFASNFMMNHGNIYDLQKILGHSTIDMTQIYAHLSPSHLSETTNIISFGEVKEDINQFRPHIGLKENEKIKLIGSNASSL